MCQVLLRRGIIWSICGALACSPCVAQNGLVEVAPAPDGQLWMPIHVSKDGTTVLLTNSTGTAVWTTSEGLRQLPGVSQVVAAAVSGTVIVGNGPAYRWTDATGLSLLPVAENALVIDQSADGRYVLGVLPEQEYGDQPFVFDSALGSLSYPVVPEGSLLVDVIGLSQSGRYVIAVRKKDECLGYEVVCWDLGMGTLVDCDIPICYQRAFVVHEPGPSIAGVDGGGPMYSWRYLSGDFAYLPQAGNCMASAISADGLRFVGFGNDHCGMPETVMGDDGDFGTLKKVMHSKFGLGTLGWTFEIVVGMSSDGRLLAGLGESPLGEPATWIAMLDERSGVSGCRSDFDGSGFVDTDDYDAFVRAFESGDILADADDSCYVDTDDFDAFVLAFEAGC